MAKQTINVGTSANAGDGEGIRDAFIKANNNFDEVYTDLDTKVDQGSITTSGLTMTGPALVGRTAATSGAVAALNSASVKSMLALDQVNNTADADKPISTATQTALNGKEATIVSGTNTQYYRGDKTWQTLNKSAVGLSNVDNTSDADKPISTLTQTALNGKAASVHTHVPADVTMASQRILGRNTAASGGAEELTSTQVKSIIGLSNVNNTSDADKPVSTATQTALDAKAAVVHTHEISSINGLQSALDGKMNTGGTFGIQDITGLEDALADKLEAADLTSGLATKADVDHTHVAADITDLLDVVAAKIHTHEIDDVNGLQSALDGKSNTGHTHAIGNVTGLQDALDSKAGATHSHVIADVTGLEAELVHSGKGFVATPGANEVMVMVIDTQFTIDLLNSVVKAGTAATAETTLDLQKNGVSIGDVVFDAAGTVGTITVTDPLDLDVETGDVLELVFPASPDATLARVVGVFRN